ncbi:hypothetical protein, partial [Pseudomonas sp. BMS12]|uniref:hypothetical protein n=1 Tax=Pseudomonas sp. BMS12 TaxID=1796033 RepID=UPI00191BFA2D
MTQAQNLQVGDLQVAGSRWLQAGFDLNADDYSFADSTFQLDGAFNQAADELIVDGYTVELTKSYRWTKVRVLNGGVITTPVASDSFTQGIIITADEVEVDASSQIDVSGKGKLGTTTTANIYGGGTYAGAGGIYSSYVFTPMPYGNYAEPRDFGLGGRTGNASSFTRGAGALELNAGTLMLNGAIRANGTTQTSFGSGSGGSLLLHVGSLQLGEQARIDASGGGST